VTGRQRGSRVNPWVVIAILALAGWFADSVLVALEIHRLPGLGPWAHLSHLWYGPPLLVAILLVARRRLAGLSAWRENLQALDDLAQELRPEMRQMAGQVTTSETKVAVLGFLWRYPTTALTAPDLAYQTGQESVEVEQALADLASLGLVEHRGACDLTFYRLTPNRRRLAQLEELIAWQESWLEQARRLAQLVGPSLRRSTEGRT
jgi:hypothetical protein